jgi:hypothetical protein
VKSKTATTQILDALVGNPVQYMPKGIAYSLKDYCELVEATGRCIHDINAGYIDTSHSPILERLGLDTQQRLTLTTEFEKNTFVMPPQQSE